MTAKIEKFIVSTKGFDDYINITPKIQDIIYSFGIKEGLASIYTPSSCVALKIIESEPGLNFDISKLMELLVPINKIYQHDNLWHDGNAFSHLKAILLGNNLSIPVFNSKLVLGEYQQIIMLDFDNKASQKEIIVGAVE